MTIEHIHAANVANRLFKTFVSDASIKPTVNQLVTALNKLAIDFSGHFISVADGDDWPRDDQLDAGQKALSAVAFNSLEFETQSVLDSWSVLFDENDKPVEELLTNLARQVDNNFCDLANNKRLDKLYIPDLCGENVQVDSRFRAFIGYELGQAAGKFFTNIPSTLKGRRDGAQFANKMEFTDEDIKRLADIIVLPIPDAADASAIDHSEDDDIIAKIKNGSFAHEIPVYLDTVELERTAIYQARFKAWYSYAEAMEADAFEDAVNFAAERVVETAKWAQDRAKQRERTRLTSVFGEGIAA